MYKLSWIALLNCDVKQLKRVRVMKMARETKANGATKDEFRPVKTKPETDKKIQTIRRLGKSCAAQQ